MESTLPRKTEVEPDRQILRAVRELGGRVTVGDVVAATGTPREPVEQSLRALLESRRGHIAVGEAGDLLYTFDPRLIRRDHVPWSTRAKEATKRFLTSAFKAWIVVMLVVYFVVFVALAVAAIVAVLSRGGERRGGGSRRHGFRFPTFWLWYMFWTPNWRMGRPYYGHQWEVRRGEAGRVPFYKKVFAFVFGPDRPRVTREQHDQETLRLIRSKRGALTAAELVEHTGLPFDEAAEEMGRLMSAYAGDVRVSGDGELVYLFPELMVTARGQVRERAPEPAWRRLTRPRPLTGNEKKSDALIAGLNGFNLFAAVTAPWWIFPRLGIAGPAAMIGLVWVPLVFSVLFFAVPVIRRLGLARENRARRAANIRKVLLGFVYRKSLEAEALTLASAVRAVRAVLDDDSIAESEVDTALQRLIVELDADVGTDPNGAVTFRFPAVRRQLEAAEQLRRELKLERKELGRIVYASDDTPERAARRDMGDFDAELRKQVPAPEVAGYEDDLDAVDPEVGGRSDRS